MAGDRVVLAETDIPREKGFMYFLEGNPLKIVKVKSGRIKKE